MNSLRLRTSLSGIKTLGKKPYLQGTCIQKSDTLSGNAGKTQFHENKVSLGKPLKGENFQAQNLFTPKQGIVSAEKTSFKFSGAKETPTTFFTTSQFKKNSTFGKPVISTSLSSKRFYSRKLPDRIQNLVDNQPTGGLIQTVDDQQPYLKPQGEEGDYDKRQFAYFVIGSTRFIAAAGIRLAVLKVLYTWSVSKDLLALSSIEVDLSPIEVGKTITVTWRGKPVFIRHRTPKEIAYSKSVPLSELRDPQTDEQRTKNPDYVVFVAICTHLGCIPLKDAGKYNAFFCPCHGSHYDISGRIREGPAPFNLEVPEHKYISDAGKLILKIG